MVHPRILATVAALSFAAASFAALGAATAAPGDDTLVSVGSPVTPFSQNKQNEPAVAIDAHAPNVVVAASNDEIDEESCAAGDRPTARSPRASACPACTSPSTAAAPGHSRRTPA